MLNKNINNTITSTTEGKIKRLKLTREKKVTWTKDTIDNSKMNRKKSKVCCIYHREELDEPCDRNKYERQ